MADAVNPDARPLAPLQHDDLPAAVERGLYQDQLARPHEQQVGRAGQRAEDLLGLPQIGPELFV